MAQNLFDFVGTANRSYTLLDANFAEVYDLRNKVWTPAYAAATYAFAIDSSLRTIFGTNTSISVGIETSIQNHATNITGSSYAQAIWATGSSAGTRLLFGKSRSGVIGSHTSGALSSGDTVVSFDAYGSDGAAFQLSGRMSCGADSAASAGVVPGRIVFSTADAAGVLQEVMRLTSGQAIYASSPSGGIGYRIGAGGTVTQATSKSTGVTLNAMCGSITMNGAALAASTTVGFTFTNSSISSADFVNVWIKSGGTNNSYLTQVSSVGSGSCRVEVRNASGGSLSEALVLGFMIFKGTTA